MISLKHIEERYRIGRLMALAAAFRGTKGGILLCSDQEWNDGGSKREIDKNYRINFTTCSLFISGAGPDSSVIRAWDEIHRRLWEASNIGKDIWTEHKGIIKEALLVVCNTGLTSTTGIDLMLPQPSFTHQPFRT